MDNDEWLRPNSYDIPDFWIWTMTNGCNIHSIFSRVTYNQNNQEGRQYLRKCYYLQQHLEFA
jgi:hypothetical protein